MGGGVKKSAAVGLCLSLVGTCCSVVERGGASARLPCFFPVGSSGRLVVGLSFFKGVPTGSGELVSLAVGFLDGGLVLLFLARAVVGTFLVRVMTMEGVGEGSRSECSVAWCSESGWVLL